MSNFKKKPKPFKNWPVSTETTEFSTIWENTDSNRTCENEGKYGN